MLVAATDVNKHGSIQCLIVAVQYLLTLGTVKTITKGTKRRRRVEQTFQSVSLWTTNNNIAGGTIVSLVLAFVM